MKEWELAILLRPLLMLGLFVLIVIPIEVLFIKFWPEGAFKRLLLTRWK